MPWMIVKGDNTFCVHKQNADKSAGKKMHCYDNEEDAKKYMRALYANSEMEMRLLVSHLTELEGESLYSRLNKIQEAFNDVRYPTPQEVQSCIVKDIYDGYVILEEDGKLYRANYTEQDGEYVFDEREKWVAVRQEYVEMEKYGGKERDDLKSSDFVFGDERTFPVMTSQDVKDAVSSWGRYKGKHSFEEFKRRLKALARRKGLEGSLPNEWKEKEASQFSFTELDKAGEERQTFIDGMAAGTFETRTGQSVTFGEDELEEYVSNTNEMLESTRTESGALVGLPIDMDAHDHKGGAGWIIGVQLDKARKVIKFLVKWTKEGAAVIENNVRRYFSPSVDDSNKSILGGSLTNWPATRNAKGHIMLRPIELSQSMKGIDMPKTLEELEAELGGLSAKLDSLLEAMKGSNGRNDGGSELDSGISSEVRELLENPDAIEEMNKRAQEMAQAAIQREQRKTHVTEFAAKIAGGTKEKPFGLPVRTGDIISLLLSLPEKQSLAVEGILEKTWHNAIDFAEHGVSGDGYPARKALPKDLVKPMREWIKDGSRSPESFFAVNPEAGSADEYDLRPYSKVKEV